MNRNSSHPNDTSTTARRGAIRRPERSSGVLPFRSHLVVLSVLFIAAGVAFILWVLHRQQTTLYQSMALQGTTIQVETIKEFRKLYSTEVTTRAAARGFEIGHDYKHKPQMLPLPATLTIELGEAINRARPGAWVRLYSDYPFSWRKETGGIRDAFGAEALRELRQHPDRPFYRFEEFQGRPSLRYAVADRMEASCVACHNGRPDSPKRDWKVGDVRGVLEFIRPLDNYGDAAVAQKRASLAWTFSATVAVFAIGMVGLGAGLRRLRRTSESLKRNEAQLATAQMIARIGSWEWDIPSGKLTWSDENYRIHGFAPGEFEVSYESALGVIHPEDRSSSEAAIKRAQREGNPFSHEQRVVRPDGTVRIVHQRGDVVLGPDGRVVKLVGTAQDITEQKRAEDELDKVHKQLLDTSRQAGMAEVATNVLHNVGNVLNSVNVSATLIIDRVHQSKAANLPKLGALLQEHTGDLANFLTTDARGRQIPPYVQTLAEQISTEQKAMIAELEELRKNIGHIKDVVAMQQSYGKVSGVKEAVAITDLIEDAIRMNASALARHGLDVVRDYQVQLTVTTDRHKVMQILVNLIRNAKIACDDSGRTDKQVTLRITRADDRVRVAVIDNGVGIPAENLTRIFNHGFTTRKEGHGFGLHSGALAAKELGGSLTVESDGPDRGATFVLELPYTPETSTP